jgi:hypothetical protein
MDKSRIFSILKLAIVVRLYILVDNRYLIHIIKTGYYFKSENIKVFKLYNKSKFLLKYVIFYKFLCLKIIL